MAHFPDPGTGAQAALDMVDALADAGMPPAHVGLHAGPVVISRGDYYRQTVNVGVVVDGPPHSPRRSLLRSQLQI